LSAPSPVRQQGLRDATQDAHPDRPRHRLHLRAGAGPDRPRPGSPRPGGDRSSVVFGQDSGRAHALLEEPDFLRADRPASLQQRLTLAEAAARLRRPLDTGGFPGALPDALGQFKSQVLAQWVQRAGPRETAAAGAASGQDSLAARAVGRITDEFQR